MAQSAELLRARAALPILELNFFWRDGSDHLSDAAPLFGVILRLFLILLVLGRAACCKVWHAISSHARAGSLRQRAVVWHVDVYLYTITKGLLGESS